MLDLLGLFVLSSHYVRFSFVGVQYIYSFPVSMFKAILSSTVQVP